MARVGDLDFLRRRSISVSARGISIGGRFYRWSFEGLDWRRVYAPRIKRPQLAG